MTIEASVLSRNKNKKVAIVGFAPSWSEAPYSNPEYDIWGINELYVQAIGRRFTHWFEIHDPKSPSKSKEKHQNWLRECKIPLYMQKHFDEYPASIPYPRDEVKAMVNKNMILEKGGSPYTDYSNQITWMALLAIYQGYEQIEIYGVDMAQQSEYAWQRAACQFAVGFALGRGIKVLVPKTSELCKYPMDYGFDTDNANRHLTKTRINSLKESIMGYKSQILDLEYQYNQKHTMFNELKNNITRQIQTLGDEMVKFELRKATNLEMIRFLKDIPKDPKEIQAKRNEVTKNIELQNNEFSKALEQMSSQVKELQAKLEREAKVDYMNLQILEETRHNLSKQQDVAGGAIGECNYNLANNRV